jgi:(p)ppGpp synthase/HD superfamily hydrolase
MLHKNISVDFSIPFFLLKVSLLENNIIAKVSYRLKDPYATLKKMILKNTSVQDLTDLIVFRVIVDTIEDCYKVLNVVYSTFVTISESFKDFIIRPKSNSYQSLHIVIIDSTVQNIELQIRSRKMHVNAEFGAASYAKYKNNMDIKIKTSSISSLINMNLTKIYNILEHFHWTKAELIAYKDELQNLFQLYQSSTNSLIYQNNQL